MSSDIEVYAAVGEKNILAGRLYPHSRRGTESASFIYNDRYLADPDAYALDPVLPLVTGTLQTPVGRALFGAFADSLPDRWGRTLIQRAERARANAAATAPRSMSEADLLLGVRDDLRQGALRFRLDEHGPFLATEESGIPVLTDLPVLLNIAARAEKDTAGYEDLKRLLRAGSSLGGARLRNLHERGDSWRLSPAFDLNPNPQGSKDLSTAIDYTDTRASIATLMSVADYFRLDADDALDVLAKVTRAAARWHIVAKSHGLTQHDLDVMEPAFEHAESERAQALTRKTAR